MGNNKYKQRNKELGLCVDCKDKALPHRIRCEKHARELVLMRRRLSQKRIKEGKCPECGATLDKMDEGYRYCINCRENLNVYYKFKSISN